MATALFTPRVAGRRSRWAGFTLLELLVAISVLALVSMIAWRGLDSLVSTRERLGPQSEDIRAMLVTLGQFERDIASVPNVALYGLRTTPLKLRLSESGQFVDLLRIAPVGSDVASAGLAPLAATTMQRVIWRVQDGVLIRAVSPQLSTLRDVAPEELTNTPLLAGVKSIRLRVWRGTEWQVPSPTEADAPIAPGGAPGVPAAPGANGPVPPGLELEVERNDGKRYRRVMLVG